MNTTPTSYPGLLDLVTQRFHPLHNAPVFTVGRNAEANLPVLDISCSRRQLRLVLDAGKYHAEALSTTSPTYCNGVLLSERVPLSHGALLQAGNSRFQFMERATAADLSDNTMAVRADEGAAVGGETVLSGSKVPFAGGEDVRLQGVIPLAGGMVIGREAGRVDILLPHVHVSRIHAQIVLDGKQALVTDLNSANGTFVNGRRLDRPTSVNAGDRIDIGPFSLSFTGSALVPESREDNVELSCRNLRKSVRDRRTGKPLTLLDGITLVVRPHEFVCILGPSGSGKSTLLSALSARAPADGKVLLNRKDLYASFELLKQDIAVVPQKDVLHELLTVEDALYYTAKLRLPPDTLPAEIRSCLDELLETVNLMKQRATPIRSLSGGQIKRASLANEILSKPSLLFLDEMTSGLDEQTDRDMMALFRTIADSGKTVVCITHNLANVERNCHLVVILTNGGKLAFVGSPAEALQYFGIARLGDVYERLATRTAEQWQSDFLAHSHHKKYVQGRLSDASDAEAEVAVPRRWSLAESGLEWARQTRLLTRRYLAIQLSDWASLFSMFGQSLLVVFLLVVLFGNFDKMSEPEQAQRAVSLLFLMTISALWFGCNNAAKEIVKEREIYTRERDFNMRVGSYLASKLALLAVLTGLQTTVLLVLVSVFCHQPGGMVGQWLFLELLGLTGVTLGLAISAAARTQDLAVTLTPMALIPQIILGGVIAPLSGFSELLGQAFVTAYWGFRGLAALLPARLAGLAGLEQHSTAQAFLVLIGHSLFFLSIALTLLILQDRRRGNPLVKFIHTLRGATEA